MKQFIGTGRETPKEILEILQANADDTGEENFVRPYADDQMKKVEQEFLSGQKEFKKLQNKINKLKKEYSGRMKPLKENNDQLLTNIELKGEMVLEEVFYFTDFAEGKVGTYDNRGNLISERAALPSELKKSANIFQMSPPAEEKFFNPNKFIESAANGTEDTESFRVIDNDDEQPI